MTVRDIRELLMSLDSSFDDYKIGIETFGDNDIVGTVTLFEEIKFVVPDKIVYLK